MLLASLLLPIAVVAIVLLVQRLHLPVFLAIMATVVVYGIAADMTFMSVGKAFGLGFTAAIEQTGLLVVAGALVSSLVLRQPLGTGTAAAAGALRGPRRVGDWRPGAAAAGRPGRAAPRARPGPHPACLRRPGDALAACRRRGVGDEDPAAHHGAGRPAARRDRGPAGLVARLAPGAGEQDAGPPRLGMARRRRSRSGC